MDDIENEIVEVPTGFDRNIDYSDMKDKLIKRIKELYERYDNCPKDIGMKRIIYAVIAAIQLKNGSRISEAVKAFILFVNKGINNRVIVKISKSGAMKTMRDGTKKKTKIRAREMMWPQWISRDVYKIITKSNVTEKIINAGTLKKRVLDYLLINFKCNTHSLRYAFINYALYVLKRPINDVAKFVGHANVAQMVTYTQVKNCNQIFELDI